MAGEQRLGERSREPRKRLGRLGRQHEHVAQQYAALAADDEAAGRKLLAAQAYRQATYFFVQAMEKYVRVRIFGTVDATNEYFRQQMKTHDLEHLLDFLVGTLSTSADVKDQVRAQLSDFVLGGVRFSELHNDLRYPVYLRRSQAYATLEVDRGAAEIVLARLEALKSFLQHMDRLTR